MGRSGTRHVTDMTPHHRQPPPQPQQRQSEPTTQTRLCKHGTLGRCPRLAMALALAALMLLAVGKAHHVGALPTVTAGGGTRHPAAAGGWVAVTSRTGPGASTPHPRSHVTAAAGSSLLQMSSASAPSGFGFAPAAPKLVLRLATSSSTQSFADHAAMQYVIMRPDLRILPLAAASSEAAWDEVRLGQVDAAIINFHPSSQVQHDTPDISVMPLWAVAFTPAANLPSAGGVPLVFSRETLARIYCGNITRWNDEALVKLNPFIVLPDEGIRLALSLEPLESMREFTRIGRKVWAQFAELIDESDLPVWPLHRYAAYSFVAHATGPLSYVISVPFSIAMVPSALATKLGVSDLVASVVNAAGHVVRPTFLSIDAALSEQAVIMATDLVGKTRAMFSHDISDAPGSRSWPYASMAMLAIPRLHSREGVHGGQACRMRSELVKFLRWLLEDDSVRYTLGVQEDAVLLPRAVDLHLGLSATLQSGLRCGEFNVQINHGALPPIELGGGVIGTMHARARNIFVESFSNSRSGGDQLSISTVEMDPAVALENVNDATRSPDAAWIFPSAFEQIWPGVLDAHRQGGDVLMMPWHCYGVVPAFHLPDAALAHIRLAGPQALPLRVDMETLGGIFTGAIRSWTDPALVARNPALAAAFVGVDTAITLVVYGQGILADVAQSPTSNAFVLGLSHTQAVRSSGFNWTQPANWLPMLERLEALGGRAILVKSEIDLEITVQRIPGAVGYHVIHSEHADPETQFSIVKIVHAQTSASDVAGASSPSPASSQVSEVLVHGTPASIHACAASAPSHDLAQLDIQALARSSDPAQSACWPFPLPVLLVLPSDIHASSIALDDDQATSHLSYMGSQEQVCAKELRVARLVEFLLLEPALASPARLSGSARLAQEPWIEAALRVELNKMMCGGEPLLYLPPIQWSLDSAVHVFAHAACFTVEGVVLLAAVLVYKYRRRSLIRVANLPLQMCMLVGIAMLLLCPPVFSIEPNPGACATLGWLLFLGCSLTFAPMAAKIWRTDAAYRARKSLRAKRTGNGRMYAVVIVFVVVDLVVLVVQSARDGGAGLLQPHTVSLQKDSRTWLHDQCAPTSSTLPLAIALVATKVLLLLYTCVKAFGVRHVTSAFGESASLSWAVWNTTFSAIILVVILVLVGEGAGDVHTFLLVFLLLWVGATTLAFAFGRKLLTLVSEDWRSAREARAAASRLSYRTSGGAASAGTSGATTRTGSGTRTGTGTGSGSGASTSIFELPSLDAVPLAVLERYLTALETQLRTAKLRRRAAYGSPPPRTRGTSGASAVDENDGVVPLKQVSRGGAPFRPSSRSASVQASPVLKARHLPHVASRSPIQPQRALQSDRDRANPGYLGLPSSAKPDGHKQGSKRLALPQQQQQHSQQYSSRSTQLPGQTQAISIDPPPSLALPSTQAATAAYSSSSASSSPRGSPIYVPLAQLQRHQSQSPPGPTPTPSPPQSRRSSLGLPTQQLQSVGAGSPHPHASSSPAHPIHSTSPPSHSRQPIRIRSPHSPPPLVRTLTANSLFGAATMSQLQAGRTLGLAAVAPVVFTRQQTT